MKKNFVLIFVSLLCAVLFVLSSCTTPGNVPNKDNSGTRENTEETNATDTGSSEKDPNPTEKSGTRILFTFEGQSVYGTLEDNSVSRDLISRLPLTLTFSDYSNTEKIASLPDGSAEWDTSDAPDSCTPAAGDIAMYAPWGNLSVFYRSFRHSDGLVPLGKLDDGGAEKFAAMGGDSSVTISLVKDDAAGTEEEEHPEEPKETDPTEEPEEPQKSKVLVAYFSCTGTTKAVAEKIAELTGGDLYEIVPAVPYTSADLNYNNSNCRANREMNDPSARPAIAGNGIDLSAYDTVILGYPIWWGTMPRIINTFLDAYDLSGKTILPFCTSGGSGVSKSVSDIRSAEPDANVRDGLRASGANDRNLEGWLQNGGAIK